MGYLILKRGHLNLQIRGGYFHSYIGSGHFWGFKILNFNIFRVFRKMNFIFGYVDFVDTF